MTAERQVRELIAQLPPTAPLVRITAGMGSAGQKTWNLRRPVTLIGTKRPAHIVLHDAAISNAHCVVVNTGTDVLLRDLHTSSGTLLNGLPIEIAPLKDGDVIRLGEMQIQVAVSTPEVRPDDSGCGLRYADPTRFASPVELQLAYTDMRWQIEQAVVVIGRHEAATVRLDHADLCSRHALLFRFQDGPALFDISDKTGLSVNEQPCSLTPLGVGDRVTLGPFTLNIMASPQGTAGSPADLPGSLALSIPVPMDENAPEEPVVDYGSARHNGSSDTAPPTGNLDDSIEKLSGNLLKSWEEMNAWAPPGTSDKTLEQRLESIRSREAELDARDATLRGKLHDLTRYHELVLERERDLGATAARIQAESDELKVGKRAFETQQQQIDQRFKELQRREQMLTQRWSRVQSQTCPHCARPIVLGAIDESK